MIARFRAVLVALVAAALLLAAPAVAAPTFPPLTGRVVDDAHVLDDATKAALTAKLAGLEQTTTRQLVVVTLPSLQGYEIADYGYQLGRAWGIGQKKQDNGVLFIIVPSEHKTRIEVGYGLEPVLTDALSSVILQEAVLPKFRAGDIQGGIVAGTDEIVKQLSLDPADAAKQVVQAKQQQSDGGNSHLSFNIVILILFLVFGIFGRIFRGTSRGSSLWWLPFLFMGGGRSSGGGWSSGGGGWSGGGGGFSGGGGSFGGGGSSGSW
ncbi:MAG TPA: TPM domain-containing protein [Rhizomicrobium sp.]|jgi:uncharacterized protein